MGYLLFILILIVMWSVDRLIRQIRTARHHTHASGS
jgi:hypothetical protein